MMTYCMQHDKACCKKHNQIQRCVANADKANKHKQTQKTQENRNPEVAQNKTELRCITK